MRNKFFVGVAIVTSFFACQKQDPLTINRDASRPFQDSTTIVIGGNTGGGGSTGGSVNTDFIWTNIADFPGTERDEAVSFSLNGMGYVGVGIKFPDHFTDFYRYDPSANTWTQVASLGSLGLSLIHI